MCSNNSQTVSPDNRHRDPMQKLQDHRAWGVANIWVVEPELKTLDLYDGGRIEKQQVELPKAGLSILPAGAQNLREVFSQDLNRYLRRSPYAATLRNSASRCCGVNQPGHQSESGARSIST